MLGIVSRRGCRPRQRCTSTFDEVFASVAEAGGGPYPGSRHDIIATELIVNRATALETDLLVMGTHRLSGFHATGFGSIPQKKRLAQGAPWTVGEGTPVMSSR